MKEELFSAHEAGGKWRQRLSYATRPSATRVIHAKRAAREAPHIPALDGWRGIAIALVVVAHAVSPLYQAGALPEWAVRVVYLGGHGVGLFFGLSGFLICTRLLHERRATGRIAVREFYVRRGFRILPPALAYLAVVGALGALGVLPVHPREWGAALLFFRNYVPVFFPEGAGRYTGHFWSLAVEEHFYLLLPILLACGRVWGLTRVLCVAAAAVGVWRALDADHGWGAHWLGLEPYTAAYRTDVRLDALLWGAAMGALLHDARWRARAARLLRPAVWGCVAAGYAALVALSWPGHLWGAVLVPAVLAGTVLHPHARAARVLGWAPLRWLGRISYSLYLWHILFMPQLAEGAPLGALQQLPLNVVCALLVAVASHRWVERPAIRLGARVAARPARPVPPPVSPRFATWWG